MNKLFKLFRIIFMLICIIIIYFNFLDILNFSKFFNNCDKCHIEIKSSMSNSLEEKLENLKITKEKLENNFNEENYKSYFYILWDCNNYKNCVETREPQTIRKNCIEKNLNFCFFDFEEKEKLIKKKYNFYNYCIISIENINNKENLCKSFKRD